MQTRVLHDNGDEMRRLRDVCDRQETLIADLQRQLDAWQVTAREQNWAQPETPQATI